MKLVARRKSEQNHAATDPWTVVHFATGLAMGLMDMSPSGSLGLAVGYELVEQYVERQEWGKELFETDHPEILTNAVVDVGFFALGHWLGRRWNRT